MQHKTQLDNAVRLQKIVDKLRLAATHFGGYVTTCRRVNQPEWMEGLVEHLNELCEELGDTARWELRNGDYIKAAEAAMEGGES